MLLSKIKKYVDFKIIAILVLIYACFMSYFELQKIKEKYQFLSKIKSYSAKNSTSVVFVGSYSSKGLALMKNILNGNQLIHCSEENHIINSILFFK